MATYCTYKDGKKIIETTQERIEKVKKLTGKYSKEIFENDLIYPEEIKLFITFLEAELEHLFRE